MTYSKSTGATNFIVLLSMFVLPSGGLDHDDSNVCLDILYSMQMSLDLMKMEEKEEEVWGK